MIEYRSKFFKTEDEANTFLKTHEGVLYRNVRYSHTKRQYLVEASMAQKSQEFIKNHPYVVAWNEFV